MDNLEPGSPVGSVEAADGKSSPKRGGHGWPKHDLPKRRKGVSHIGNYLPSTSYIRLDLVMQQPSYLSSAIQRPCTKSSPIGLL